MTSPSPQLKPLSPTRDFEFTDEGKLIVPIYDQTGQIVKMTAKDTRSARDLVVWLRKYDRITPIGDE